MNELRVKSLLIQLKNLVNDLESEIRNHPETYVKYDDSLYSEIKTYNEYNDDDGWTD